MSATAQRIDEALRLVRMFEGHPYEAAALAYLHAVVGQARRAQR